MVLGGCSLADNSHSRDHGYEECSKLYQNPLCPELVIASLLKVQGAWSLALSRTISNMSPQLKFKLAAGALGANSASWDMRSSAVCNEQIVPVRHSHSSCWLPQVLRLLSGHPDFLPLCRTHRLERWYFPVVFLLFCGVRGLFLWEYEFPLYFEKMLYGVVVLCHLEAHKTSQQSLPDVARKHWSAENYSP